MSRATLHSIPFFPKIVLLSLLVLVTQVASGGSNTAEFLSTATGDMTIIGVMDPTGAPIMLPQEFGIFPATIGPSQTEVEKSGSGVLTFAGTAGFSGTGGATQVNIASDLGETAVPVGVADDGPGRIDSG